jgi:glycosyltransferase involved in cell wall biosynthesis
LRGVILFLHNRYRTTGGEERAVADLMWLVRERLREDAELLERDSAGLARSEAAAGMLAGGLRPDEVARAVRRTGARVVHAHNLNPTLGWRALAAAREAGAKVVLHLHQYRLVCAIGVCFTRGGDCTRCHGRNTVPGVLLRCRGSTLEAAVYGAGLALWQRRLAAQADALIVPSRFARLRLRELGAPVGRTHVVAPVVRPEPPQAGRQFAGAGPSPPRPYALVSSRLAPEKGIETAIEACRLARMQLVVAGEGPERERLRQLARGADVRFTGQLGDAQLAPLRAGAAVALMPSRAAETFGLAAAEAMAAGVPVIASRIGALPELVPERWLVAPGDPRALAGAIAAVRTEPEAGAEAAARARAVVSPEVVAPALAAVYG